jgi:DNA-binding NarL/FixJ family response regulator
MSNQYPRLTSLSQSEQNVAYLILEGKSAKDISNILNRTKDGITSCITVIYNKLGIPVVSNNPFLGERRKEFIRRYSKDNVKTTTAKSIQEPVVENINSPANVPDNTSGLIDRETAIEFLNEFVKMPKSNRMVVALVSEGLTNKEICDVCRLTAVGVSAIIDSAFRAFVLSKGFERAELSLFYRSLRDHMANAGAGWVLEALTGAEAPLALHKKRQEHNEEALAAKYW